jgi:cytochrome c biogenesis protein CcmG, thiol:disulfide interchange protein DsbE
MSPRRLIVATLSAIAFVLLIAGMVRYTRRVEAGLREGVSAGPVKLLKERPEIAAFTAPDLNGQPVSMAALRGKVVIINFWATWCPPCRAEIPELIALQSKYKDTLQIIGISQDSGSLEEVRQFAREHGMNYPIVMSTPEIEKLFPGIYALPTSFILDHDGRMAQKHIGQLNASLTETETRALAGLDRNVEIVYVEDADKVRLANAAQANKIPGIDLSTLSPERRAQALQALNTEQCTCGCGLTLAQCRLDDPDCGVSLPLAQELVKKIAAK